MEKDQIIILENRGLLSVIGEDAKEFLQNIITNDVNKVSKSNSIFAALLSPQGKYLFEFFVIKKNGEYLLDCDGNSVNDLANHLSKYKIVFPSNEYCTDNGAMIAMRGIQKIIANKAEFSLDFPVFSTTRRKKKN